MAATTVATTRRMATARRTTEAIPATAVPVESVGSVEWVELGEWEVSAALEV